MNDTTKPAHTPTPWQIYNLNGTMPGEITIRSAKLTRIAELSSNRGDAPKEETVAANAALIVRAVNSHAELVAALEMADRGLAGMIDDERGGTGTTTLNLTLALDALKHARAALAKAKGQQ